jgi:hypothetical protein
MAVVINGKRKLNIGKYSFVSEERPERPFTFIFTSDGNLIIKSYHSPRIEHKFEITNHNGHLMARITFEDFYCTYELLLPNSRCSLPSFSTSLVCVDSSLRNKEKYIGKEHNFIIEFQ